MVCAALRAFRIASLNEPLQLTLVGNVKGALRVLGDSVPSLKRPVAHLTPSDVASMLRNIESELGTRLEQSHLASKFSAGIRALLSYGPDRLKDGSSLTATIEDEFPRLRRRRRLPRNPLPPTLGHIPHVDWQDLRDQTFQAVQRRILALEVAISAEFDRYDHVLTLQRALLCTPTTPQVTKQVAEWIKRLRPKSNRVPPAIERDILLACILQIEAADYAAGERAAESRIHYPNRRFLADLPELDSYQANGSTAPWFGATRRLPNPVLTAIFLLLLVSTAWNVESVGSLTSERVKRTPNGGYRMQGYKAKTDDDTPIVDVHPTQKLIVRALDLLLWNHAQLRSLGLIDDTEKRLWFGWQKNDYTVTTDLLESGRVSAFASKHNLERFTPSSIRPLRAANTYLPQRDIEAVRVLLGHRELSVTDSYLKETLFWRMNESNMLQYQRRIEASLTFWRGGLELVSARQLSESDVDFSLVPTGDGGACTDPKLGPPQRPRTEGSTCPGLYCQEGNGCPNYRLSVTPQTLEMALRTQQYYRERWQAIYRANPACFAQLHLPRLLFIHVLIMIVEDRRPDILEHARRLHA